MTALPLSASADAPRDPCIEPIASPATLPTEVRAYVTGQVDDAIAHRVLWAVDDAIEAWHRDNEPEVTRQERTWARRVA